MTMTTVYSHIYVHILSLFSTSVLRLYTRVQSPYTLYDLPCICVTLNQCINDSVIILEWKTTWAIVPECKAVVFIKTLKLITSNPALKQSRSIVL